MAVIDLYIDDLERILSMAKLHESVNRKFGITQLCTINAIDSSGNTLGVITQDKQGKTCFKLKGSQ